MDKNRGNFESNLQFLVTCNVLKHEDKVLEIGSGMGIMVSELKRQGYDVSGTEINDEYIQFANDEYGIVLQKMLGEKLGFADTSFDAVLSFDVLEHIPDADSHLREVNRVLKTGGYYLFGTPNKLTNIPLEIIKERSLTKYKSYHCSLHSYWELNWRLRQNGFKPRFVAVPVVNEFFINKLKKYFGRVGLGVLKVINPDKLPFFLRTNFYVVAQKI